MLEYTPTPRLAHSSDPASRSRAGKPSTQDRRPSSNFRAKMLQLRPWLWYLRGTLSRLRVTPMTDPYSRDFKSQETEKQCGP